MYVRMYVMYVQVHAIIILPTTYTEVVMYMLTVDSYTHTSIHIRTYVHTVYTYSIYIRTYLHTAYICDRLCKNWPSSHLVVIRETPV